MPLRRNRKGKLVSAAKPGQGKSYYAILERARRMQSKGIISQRAVSAANRQAFAKPDMRTFIRKQRDQARRDRRGDQAVRSYQTMRGKEIKVYGSTPTQAAHAAARKQARIDRSSVAQSNAGSGGGSETVKSYTQMRGGKSVVVRGFTRRG